MMMQEFICLHLIGPITKIPFCGAQMSINICKIDFLVMILHTEINEIHLLRDSLGYNQFVIIIMPRRSQKADQEYNISEQREKKPKTRSQSKKEVAKKPKEETQKSKKIKPKSVNKSQKSEQPEKKKRKKVLKKAKPTQGYTQAQKAQYKALYDKYHAMSIDTLKGILAANSQTKTGTKDVLAERCADGKLLGKIPMCSSCGGGRLKFNRDTGIYRCPGYMDDDVFKNCEKKYEMAEIVREPWTEP